MAERPRVSRAELLKRMGITERDFDNYLKKVSTFFELLNRDEKGFYARNNGRTVEQVAKSLGPDVTREDIEHLFSHAPRIEELLLVACCRNVPPPPPPH